MKKIRKLPALIYISLIIAFLYLPILVMVLYSFNEGSATGAFTGFTLKWYGSVFQNQSIIDALVLTVSIAVISTIVSTILGTVAAIGINATGKGWQSVVSNITYVPMLNPDIVTGISMMLLFVLSGISRGYATMLIAHITFSLPYVIFSVLPKLKQLESNTFEAALDLGAKPAYAIRKIVVPQIMPGIVTGALLAFTMSIDDFIISLFVSGKTNLSKYVYSTAKLGVKPEINAISTIVFVSIIILLLIVNLRNSKTVSKEN